MSVRSPSDFFARDLQARMGKRMDLAWWKINAVFLFAISGDDGGSWRVDLTVPDGTVTEGGGEADCTISMSSADFVSVVNGELNMQMALMAGRMQIDGDMGLAMQLDALLVPGA